ncbi:hypothetical protein Y032_0108g22 [Ancylostoma ceylanicum]|uniref:Uncharacterized protein n=1 Tax=Ancylostoma ceylanicum TaxID=53326 RepID=A0A016TEZ9_9BILA|nr:hypothetical protein Y032_0108g22 [Ancylostoma ceylanicum]
MMRNSTSSMGEANSHRIPDGRDRVTMSFVLEIPALPVCATLTQPCGWDWALFIQWWRYMPLLGLCCISSNRCGSLAML